MLDLYLDLADLGSDGHIALRHRKRPCVAGIGLCDLNSAVIDLHGVHLPALGDGQGNGHNRVLGCLVRDSDGCTLGGISGPNGVFYGIGVCNGDLCLGAFLVRVRFLDLHKVFPRCFAFNLTFGSDGSVCPFATINLDLIGGAGSVIGDGNGAIVAVRSGGLGGGQGGRGRSICLGYDRVGLGGYGALVEKVLGRLGLDLDKDIFADVRSYRCVSFACSSRAGVNLGFAAAVGVAIGIPGVDQLALGAIAQLLRSSDHQLGNVCLHVLTKGGCVLATQTDGDGICQVAEHGGGEGEFLVQIRACVVAYHQLKFLRTYVHSLGAGRRNGAGAACGIAGDGDEAGIIGIYPAPVKSGSAGICGQDLYSKGGAAGVGIKAAVGIDGQTLASLGAVGAGDDLGAILNGDVLHLGYYSDGHGVALRAAVGGGRRGGNSGGAVFHGGNGHGERVVCAGPGTQRHRIARHRPCHCFIGQSGGVGGRDSGCQSSAIAAYHSVGGGGVVVVNAVAVLDHLDGLSGNGHPGDFHIRCSHRAGGQSFDACIILGACDDDLQGFSLVCINRRVGGGIFAYGYLAVCGGHPVPLVGNDGFDRIKSHSVCFALLGRGARQCGSKGVLQLARDSDGILRHRELPNAVIYLCGSHGGAGLVCFDHSEPTQGLARVQTGAGDADHVACVRLAVDQVFAVGVGAVDDLGGKSLFVQRV